ncbi:hypothetical protein HOLleu_13418 [Holothuria leucospilota]|uniref:Uncharacterized protein n=1 Tax=Holothuria leucospilota TaxID=206669 RepID=A0A9Q1CCY2_HOLLE|nr:hypothetical protein HOLleu_13418 [Holothuria leucospilota]
MARNHQAFWLSGRYVFFLLHVGNTGARGISLYPEFDNVHHVTDYSRTQRCQRLHISLKLLKKSLMFYYFFSLILRYFTQQSIIEKVPVSFVILSVIFVVMLVIGIAFIFDQRKHANGDGWEEPLCETSTSATEILHKKTYWLLAGSMCFCHQYILFMAMNFKTYGQTIINDDSFLTYIGSFSSISAAVGRVIFGLLLDKASLKFNVLLSCLCQTSSMLLLGFTSFHHIPVVYALIVHLAAANFGGTVMIFQIASWRAFGGNDKGLSVGLVNIGYSVSVVSCVIISKTVMNVWSWSGIFLCFSLSPVIGKNTCFSMLVIEAVQWRSQEFFSRGSTGGRGVTNLSWEGTISEFSPSL